jgi:ABC-type dipeptide/oligopeptide/nickel transport system permease component
MADLEHQVTLAAERARQRLAFLIVYLLAGVIVVIVVAGVVGGLACWSGGTRCDAVTRSLAVLTNSTSTVFTALIGLTGSIIGFYFGSRKIPETRKADTEEDADKPEEPFET